MQMIHIPRRFWKKLTKTKIYNYLPDQWAVSIKYRNHFYKKLDLKNPQTFNEKLQWLKLYDRRPEYTRMVDKYLAKEYVASIIGEEYIIPTLGVWKSFDEIDFDALPDQFVLKCNHGSGDVVICKDKKTLDIAAARKKLTAALKQDYYLVSREWPYKNVNRVILAEQYLEDVETQDARDYKFFCFDGKPEILFVATERSTDCRFDFFDMDFRHLDIENIHPQSDRPIPRPASFGQMNELAARLSRGMKFVRIDLYEINGKVYFSEYTIYHAGGFWPMAPMEWEYRLGDLIRID